ncbi:MAG: response regulator [Planctomycetota bacterium]|nr:response regulator [Planctomycetota bacterium]
MRLEDLTPDDILRAVEIYVERAWADKSGLRFDISRLQGKGTLEELFAEFSSPTEERKERAQHRYTLQLGNSSYPFMKFVVQEYLLESEYFFSVDTHDEHVEVGEEDPDHAGWELLKRRNMALKEEIEAAWHEVGLPTHEDLLRLAEGFAQLEMDHGQKGRILVVDDEVDVAKSVQALLLAKGYEVELAHDGLEVLERLASDPIPDLVLLDLSMPEMDGEAVLRSLRGDVRLRELPVLLATASEIDLGSIPRVAGFLRKPYTREMLFAMLETLLSGESD